MQNIFINLMDISWWFTILFPILIVYSVPKIFRRFLNNVKKQFRLIEARFWIKNRRKIFDDLLIQREMFSAQSAFGVFVIFVSVGLLILLTSSFVGGDKRNVVFAFLMVVPILLAEIFWLIKDGRVDDLIKRRQRWLLGKKKLK